MSFELAQKPELAPFCWGSSIVYDSGSSKCNHCSYENECANECASILTEIQKQTDVTDYLKSIQQRGIEITIQESANTIERVYKKSKPSRKKNSAIPVSLLTSLEHAPKKSQTIITRILKQTIDLKSDIKSGRNPFCGEKPAYLEGVCNALLLDLFTREQMMNELSKISPTWSEATLRSHFNSSIQALLAMQVIERSDNSFKVCD